jgi:dynein heavy chain 1
LSARSLDSFGLSCSGRPKWVGKTETVKALGAQLGRFVLVFNCDEKFDFNAMGRWFCGLCQVGAWGFFDEFNRLEEGILYAVTQQILGIQHLWANASHNDLLGRCVRLDPHGNLYQNESGVCRT